MDRFFTIQGVDRWRDPRARLLAVVDDVFALRNLSLSP